MTTEAFQQAAERLIVSAEKNPSIQFKDRDVLLKSIITLLTNGVRHLHFIFDFDMTMTKYWIEKKGNAEKVRNYSSHSVISLSPRTSQRFKLVEENLFSTYYKIEVNPTLTMEEKIPHMIEWWSESHENIIEEKLTRNDFDVMAKECPIEWREDLPELLTDLDTANIPVLVFSAGIAQTIASVLKHANLLHKNVHIVSNEIIFEQDKPLDDGSALAVSVREPFIHVFNKGEFAIRDTPFYKTVCPPERDNVILIGDSLGDVHMKDGVNHTADLTVGLLNHDKDIHLNKYLDAYKIVFTDDLSLSWVRELISEMIILGV